MTIKNKLLTIISSLVIGASASNAAEALTPEQLKQEQLKLEMAKATNQSDVGLVSVTHADGTVSRDLKGRFQNFSKVTVDANGNKHFICNMHPDIEHSTHKADGTPAIIKTKAVLR